MVSRLAKEPAVGLVVVTHGSAADCMLDAVAGILGPLPGSQAVPISMKGYTDAARNYRTSEQRRSSWLWRMFS